MERRCMHGKTADLVIRAGTVHSMVDAPDGLPTALAVRDGEIVAVAGPDRERELLEEWSGSPTPRN